MSRKTFFYNLNRRRIILVPMSLAGNIVGISSLHITYLSHESHFEQYLSAFDQFPQQVFHFLHYLKGLRRRDNFGAVRLRHPNSSLP